MCRRALVQRLAGAARVTQISAPAGSGKTVLLRSWICQEGLEDNVAWVSAQSQERDPQQFWISVADALRVTIAGSKLVRPLTAAPDLDGWTITERLQKDLAPLDERLWLVIDDLHELSSAELGQLELLVTRTPSELRFVLSARHDVRLGLHRLRLEGQLSEIRAADLAFSAADARALFEAAGVELSGSALALLHERTEGWAAGLRLAALSLAGHPDPERFAADFSGSERTVADYLLAEVLDRQSQPVRLLLLRTSVLDRVNGELADLLTGGSGGERILQDLDDAGAFVVGLDAQRSWFRYRRLFADLLQLELRRGAPGEVAGLHVAAAGWYAEHGYPVEAVRHAQAAADWGLAARVLSDHFLGLVLGGQGTTAQQLLARFPADVIAADAELATLMAAHELLRGSPDAAERYRARAVHGLASMPADRRERFQVELAIMRLCLAQGRGDLPVVEEEADRLLAPAGDADAARPVSDELRALALVTLGAAEVWALRAQEAERHLEQGTALARRTGWPWLEVSGLAHWAMAAGFRSFTLQAERGMQAIELASQHGWTEEPIVAVAYAALAGARVWQGRPADAEPLLDRAERTLRTEVQPVAGLMLCYLRGLMELASGRNQEALAAFRAGERLTGLVVAGHPIATRVRAFLLHTLIRMGETRRAEQALAEIDPGERAAPECHVAVAALRLAQGNPRAATDALAPVLDGSILMLPSHDGMMPALLLEAIARNALGDPTAAGHALARAFDLGESEGVVLPFLLYPVDPLLRSHARQATTHAALIHAIQNSPAPTAPAGRSAPPARDEAVGRSARPEPLSASETRVLRFLPTNLSAPEIAAELSVSVHTVRTHMRHVYAKLGAHHRTDAVERARACGLLTPGRRPGAHGG